MVIMTISSLLVLIDLLVKVPLFIASEKTIFDSNTLGVSCELMTLCHFDAAFIILKDGAVKNSLTNQQTKNFKNGIPFFIVDNIVMYLFLLVKA